MEKPLVSVIIPVYNRNFLLKEAVLSVAAQTFTNFELIIIDDCSNCDPEPEIAMLPGIKNINLKFIKLKKHSGMPGFVRNKGASEAQGDFLAFLDSDDLWLPEKLQTQLDFIFADDELRKRYAQSNFSIFPNPDEPYLLQDEKTKTVICHTREKWIRGSKIISQTSQKHNRSGDIFSDCLLKCIMGPSTVMVGTELFKKTGGFREDLEIAEDYELWIRIAAFYNALYIDKPLTVKRAGKWEQLSQKYNQIEIFRIDALGELIKNNFFPPQKLAEAKAVFAQKCRIYAAGCRKRGKIEEALKYENSALH